MGYRKSRKNVLSAIIVLMSIAAFAGWQFYTFVTFKTTNGMFDLQRGTQHFWWAVGFGLVACTVAVLNRDWFTMQVRTFSVESQRNLPETMNANKGT